MRDQTDRLTIEMPFEAKRGPGRLKTSPLSKVEQNALAQANRREKMTKAGYKWKGFWLRPASTEQLANLKSKLHCASQDEALALLLSVAMLPEVMGVLSKQLSLSDDDA